MVDKELNEILGTRLPFIQGGMANIATGAFAAACSDAGAMGLIAAGGMHLDVLQENIRQCRSLTDKPFGVNLMLMHRDIDAMAQMVIDEGVRFVTTGAGNPARFMSAWKEAGITVFPVVPSVALARRVVEAGADGVIAEGTESGGHVGELTTMALVYQVAQAVDVPVVAAGGVASGAQYLAVRALGACGAQVGTCLLVSEECPIHPAYKEAVLKANDTSTVVFGRIAGVPVRALKNPMAREYVKREKEGETREQLEELTLGALRKAVWDGDVHDGSLMCGQVAGQLSAIRPVKDILDELYDDSNTRLHELAEEM